MAVILQRVIGGNAQKRLVLSNSQAARPLIVGSTWNELRIGIRWHMRDSGANIVGNPQFFLGLSAGSAVGQQWGDATTAHAVGVNTNAATWTRNADRYVVSGVGNFFPAKRVGSTITRGTTLETAWCIGNGAAAATADRTLLFAQILKGSPNFSFRLFYRSNTAPVDISQALFLEQMQVLGTPVVTDHVFSAAQTLAVDEGVNGALNHVHVMWAVPTPEIEIEDLAVARIS